MKKLLYTTVAVLCLSGAPVYADGMPDIPVDNRIKIFTYSPADVFTVPTKYGYQTSIAFAHNEEVKTVSVGDRSMWQIVPSANRIFIRPMDDGLATNMTVITNIREYNFDIKSVKQGENTNLYVIQFRYPDTKATLADTLNDGEFPAASRSAATATPAAAGNVAIPPLDTQRTQDINEQYSYTGPDAVAPSQVYDDGKNTYIMYDALPKPAPKPMVKGAGGKSALAKHRIEGNKIILSTVTSGFTLVHPQGTITVYNDLYK